MPTTTRQREQIARYLEQFALQKLFIEELGWDRYTESLAVEVDGTEYTLQSVAEKKGVVALVCAPDAKGGVPDYATRKKIEEQVNKRLREHLIIFADAQHTQQYWLWVRRKPGERAAYRGEQYYNGQSGERLIQKLQQIAIDMDDEETLTLIDVTLRVEQGFDVEKVTKKFYDRFQKEHEVFVQAISGIADPELQRWYASLMLNRLMFAYFIQRKGFLDGDTNYLPNRLMRVQALGPNMFHSFYRSFLLHLFHDGLGKPVQERKLTQELAQLIGKVPYLNGGLFEVHQIESGNRAIAIPDDAFERIFAFFDEYDWYLDDRPLRNDKEINPDVLGYIFEKYINQKQMGAYYTKEDITGYIGRNTILPFVFDQAREKCKAAFEPGGEVWRLMQDDPDRYIYEAVRRGVDEPLPEEIAAGVHDISKRGGWNRPASEPFALPTETWREHVARRMRCLELRRKLARGEVTAVNDLITYNLDIERLACDVIERCEGPEVLLAFWRAITSVTILDPTCGSGAFLFAALNILKPLYEACLDRMRAFLNEFKRQDEEEKGQDFREILRGVERHRNWRYFILKSIIVNNLYGVDIMEEACEIAKLRLFLTLVAQVDDVAQLEPLPDIDFNIRAGNTLVGFTSLDAVREAIRLGPDGTPRLMLDPGDEESLKQIELGAQEAARAFKRYRSLQTDLDTRAATTSNPGEAQQENGEAIRAAKRDLQSRLEKLRDTLDHHLAREYRIQPQDDLFKFEPWRESHQPFHWFVEFYDILHARGGFDVIIGNPPYVEYKDVKSRYSLVGFETLPAGDLYAFVTERTYNVVLRSGRVGLIIPISIFGTPGFRPLQELTLRTCQSIWVSSFANRPSQLFEGAQKRLTILLGYKGMKSSQQLYTSAYLRWTRDEREPLFPARLSYGQAVNPFRVHSTSLEKLGHQGEIDCFSRISSFPASLKKSVVDDGAFRLFYTRKFGYFLAFLDFVPRMAEIETGKATLPSELKSLSFKTAQELYHAVAALTSSTFFWFWNVLSDCRNLNRTDILSFPFNGTVLSPNDSTILETLARRYLAALRDTSHMMVKSGKSIETFNYSACKPIIDEIDGVLAKYYGFTDEELDFIINYDIKYRMGQDSIVDGSDEE
jgi:hypothetical protein